MREDCRRDGAVVLRAGPRRHQRFFRAVFQAARASLFRFLGQRPQPAQTFRAPEGRCGETLGGNGLPRSGPRYYFTSANQLIVRLSAWRRRGSPAVGDSQTSTRSMKVVILAGGLGTRISEESYLKPKPMIEIGGKPILWHIMKIYSAHGVNDFVICCGYKGYVIKEYFANYFLHMSDVTFDMADNSMRRASAKSRAMARDAGRHRRKHADRRPPQARCRAISRTSRPSASPMATG